MRQVLCWLLLAVLQCLALHESDAGKIDWHKELIGLPRIETNAVAPKFQLAAGRTQRSFIVTVSKNNVLAAVNAADGEIAWRQVLDPFDLISVYRSNPGFVATLSGPGGAYLRSYNVTNGHLIFESRFHQPDAGRLLEPPSIGQDVAFSVDKTSDIFSLSNAYSARRVDGLTGKVKWTWTSEDQSSSILFCKIVATESITYLIGLTKSFKSYTLHIVALDAATGTSLSSLDVSSDINRPSDFITLISSRSSQPILAWLEDGHIKSVALSPELKMKVHTIRENIYKEIQDVGISDAGIFVALKRDDTSHAIRIEKDAQKIGKVWEFSGSATSPDHSQSTYAGGLDKNGQPYIARIYWSHIVKSSSVQLFAANGADGKGMMTGYTFPFDSVSHGLIQHFTLEVANPQPYIFVARVMLTTSTGALQLWQQERIQWTREESLTEIKSVEFVDLPEQKVVEDTLHDNTFFTRLFRQIKDARGFPAYAKAFSRRFLVGSSLASSNVPEESTGPLWRDAFGFRKLLVVATATGKIFGIDTAHGRIVWGRLLSTGSSGGHVDPLKSFAVTTVLDGKQPEIVLLAHRQSFEDTSVVLYHFEALTGLNLRGDVRKRDILTGIVSFKGTVADAYLLRGEHKTVVIVGNDNKVRLYPNDETTRDLFAKSASSLHFALESANHQLIGERIHSVVNEGNFATYTAWTASLDPTERINAVIRRFQEPTASLGKVLGDRSTLYKYLNPHLMAVLTVSKATPTYCSVYLVDGAKGTVLYHANLPGAGGICNVQAALSENWLVYHYYNDGSDPSDNDKGYRMVSVELYEESGVDNKTGSADLSSYSYDSSLLTAFEESFVFPVGITAMAITSTKFGISSKDLLLANVRQQIQSIPRRFLDPRRPKRKPTAQEQEEWLMQYDPLLPDYPRRVISHKNQVAGTHKIVTSPALLESTSIVLAYGLDLFLTRVAPSNTFDILSESFNKLQLVLTIIALAIGIMVTKPMVQRKQMRQRWYYS